MILLSVFFFLMIRRPTSSTRTDPLFPYTTLFRSFRQEDRDRAACPRLLPVLAGTDGGAWPAAARSASAAAVMGIDGRAAMAGGLSAADPGPAGAYRDRKSTRLNSSH